MVASPPPPAVRSLLTMKVPPEETDKEAALDPKGAIPTLLNVPAPPFENVIVAGPPIPKKLVWASALTDELVPSQSSVAAPLSPTSRFKLVRIFPPPLATRLTLPVI